MKYTRAPQEGRDKDERTKLTKLLKIMNNLTGHIEQMRRGQNEYKEIMRE